MVLDGAGSLRSAMLGDKFAEILVRNGWAGIMINGAVRDAARLARIQLAINALGMTFYSSAKKGIGALDVPVAFGSVLFKTDQCIYFDEDSVLIAETPFCHDLEPPVRTLCEMTVVFFVKQLEIRFLWVPIVHNMIDCHIGVDRIPSGESEVMV